MSDLTKLIAERGDLAHLALFLWASGASALLALAFANSSPPTGDSNSSCASSRASIAASDGRSEMMFRLFDRAPRGRGRVVAKRDPEEVMRAFWRTLERIAPRQQGGGRIAATIVREKP